MAGAALTCMHHARMRIYREPKHGKAACGTHAVAAALVAVARSTRSDHWPTDMLAGAALGVVAGWVLPRLLHRAGLRALGLW